MPKCPTCGGHVDWIEIENERLGTSCRVADDCPRCMPHAIYLPDPDIIVDPTSDSPDPVGSECLFYQPHGYLRGFKAMKRPCLVLLWKKRATHWVCLYRMLIPINDCRGKLIRVKLGETKVTPGDSTWNPLRGPDEGMALNTPFRDGAHIRWDARKLLMPAYVIYGKVCDVVRDCITHEELR